MDIESLIPKIIRAGFENDYESLENFSLMISRKLKSKFPDISSEIANTLAYKNIGNTAYRSIGVMPSPVDEATRFQLVKIDEPLEIEKPILHKDVEEQLFQLLEERTKSHELLEYGVRPSNTIILYGEPGVGKTYSARWIASQLNMPLITLDLASTISSYLGKTGQNIKNILDYSKSFDSVLFLDEFDAIAKKRDDSSDIGELKRIVNVLLKELENWPVNCIIIAATNHPELLDKAIWRRFDIKLDLGLPDEKIRYDIITRELEDFKFTSVNTLKLISILTDGINAADLCKLCERAKRRYILSKENFNSILLSELKHFNLTFVNKDKALICRRLKELVPSISVKEMMEITGVSRSSVYRYLNNK